MIDHYVVLLHQDVNLVDQNVVLVGESDGRPTNYFLQLQGGVFSLIVVERTNDVPSYVFEPSLKHELRKIVPETLRDVNLFLSNEITCFVKPFGTPCDPE